MDFPVSGIVPALGTEAPTPPGPSWIQDALTPPLGMDVPLESRLCCVMLLHQYLMELQNLCSQGSTGGSELARSKMDSVSGSRNSGKILLDIKDWLWWGQYCLLNVGSHKSLLI